MPVFRYLFTITHTTVAEFFNDRATQFAAALSFYAAFSLAPLLVIMLSVLALVLDGAEARDYVITRLNGDFGQEVAATVSDMLDRAKEAERSGSAALFASAAMLIGATAVIMSMKSALDHIFGGHDHATTRELWISIVKARFKAFLMVLILAFLIAVSLLLTALAAGMTRAIDTRLPEWVAWIDLDLAAWANAGIGALLLTALLYIFYRLFPDRPPARRPALIGALVAVGLFSLSKGILEWYVAKVSGAWAFGTAGALAVVLFWIFVSANTALLGAVCAKCLDRESKFFNESEEDSL